MKNTAPGRPSVRLPLTLGLAAIFLLCLVVPAGADRRVVSDGNDVHGRLDIKTAVAAHLKNYGGTRLVRHRVMTYRAWRKRALADGASHIEFLFDADPDRKDDLQVTVDVRRGKLSARITDLDRNRRLGKARVWRSTHRSVTIALSKSDLGGETYKWHALTSYHRDDSRKCGNTSDVAVVCGDRIPNRGSVLHQTR